MKALLDTPARLQAALLRLRTCKEARIWAKRQTYAQAWATCQNPEWLLRLLEKTQALTPILNERLVCRFAREVLPLNPDPRVLTCIETREAWADGKATDAARDAAKAAAWAASVDAPMDAAGPAAGAAARATAGDASKAAAGAAAWAAAGNVAWDATWDAAGNAAWDAAWAAAWAAARARQSDMIRELTLAPIL